MMQSSGLLMMTTWLLVMTSPETVARLTLLMNETETSRLLGVPGELYYVREGQSNVYALAFTQPLHTNVTRIFFDWFDNSSATDPPMEYSLGTSLSNVHALYQPTFSISPVGTVPKRRSGFSVTLLCTGLLSTDVKISIHINVTAPAAASAESLRLNIQRRKTCIRRIQQTPQTINHKQHANKAAADDNSRVGVGNAEDIVRKTAAAGEVKVKVKVKDEDDAMFSSTLFYACVAVVAGFIIVVVVVAVVCYLLVCSRARRHHVTRSALSQPNLTAAYGEMERCITPSGQDKIANNNRNKKCTVEKPVLSVAGDPAIDVIKDAKDNAVDSLRSVFHALKIEPCRLRLVGASPIASGIYSSVHRAVVVDSADDRYPTPALVKTVAQQHDGGHVTARQVRAAMRDARRLVGVDHVNICAVAAACFDSVSSDPAWFVYHCSATSTHLKTFLDESRTQTNLLDANSVKKMVRDMTSAVTYLHRCGIVHRDIAARNFLVDVKLLAVRLTDGALASDFFPEAYRGNVDDDGAGALEGVPVRWMAVEQLEDVVACRAARYQPTTDVWALGVALWELMTSGLEPYADVAPQNLASYLRRGFRLSQPVGCSTLLYEALTGCWMTEPDCRPTSAQLLQQAMNDSGSSSIAAYN